MEASLSEKDVGANAERPIPSETDLGVNRDSPIAKWPFYGVFQGYRPSRAARKRALDSLFRPLYSRPIIKRYRPVDPRENGDLTTKKTSPMMLQSLTT